MTIGISSSNLNKPVLGAPVASQTTAPRAVRTPSVTYLDAFGKTQRLSQVPPTGLSEAALKSKILRIVNENTTNTDADSLREVRAQLNPLIADLARLYGKPSVKDELGRGLART